MIPLQNIPRASRHCSSYRSLPLGEQQPWGLLLLGLTACPVMKRDRPLFLPYIRWTFVHFIHSEVRCAGTSVFPTILAGFTRTKRHASVHSSFVPALNLFQGDRSAYFGSIFLPLNPRFLGPLNPRLLGPLRTLEPWFNIFLLLPDLRRQPLPLLPFSDLPGSSFVLASWNRRVHRQGACP